MLDRLRYFNYRNYIQRENIGFIIAGLFGLWVVWNTLFVVLKNNRLQNQIAELSENVALLELENQNLELGITYYQTDDYLELAARDDLLLRAPGENVAIAPKTRDASYNPFPQSNAQNSEDRSNFQQWIDFLLGRS